MKECYDKCCLFPQLKILLAPYITNVISNEFISESKDVTKGGRALI